MQNKTRLSKGRAKPKETHLDVAEGAQDVHLLVGNDDSRSGRVLDGVSRLSSLPGDTTDRTTAGFPQPPHPTHKTQRKYARGRKHRVREREGGTERGIMGLNDFAVAPPERDLLGMFCKYLNRGVSGWHR